MVLYLRVFDRNTVQVIGRLVDITREGILLAGEDRVKTGTIFQLRMILPEGLFGKEQLDFDAKSLWCKPDVNPDLSVTGFKFLNVASGDVEIIESLVDEYGFKD